MSQDAVTSDAIDFSLIIPAYNEAVLLPRLLETVRVARDSYTAGPDRIEVIVADNCSTDATADIARAAGCRVAPVQKRLIASARNGGAAVARGAIVCFTDADGQIHPETFNAIKRAMDTGRYVAGASRVTMERWSLGIATTYAMMIGPVALLGMDTGVVFCLREDFIAVDGYNEERRYAEDVQFLLDLKTDREGARPARLIRLKGVKTIASARKWDTYGEWHHVRMMLAAPFLAAFSRRRLDDFVQEYWYKDR